MERELLRVLNAVKEKTAIEVQAVSENGIYYASTQSEFCQIEQELFLEDKPIIQTNKNTYFKFVFSSVKFIGMIKGDGVIENNYAELIQSFIELSENKAQELSFEEQLGLIVTGNSTKSRIIHFINKYSIPKTPLFVMVIKSPSGTAVEVQEFLSNYYVGSDGSVVLAPDSCAYVKYMESDDSVENFTPIKQAEMVKRFIYEESGLNVSVYVGATVKNFLDVAVSYNQALTAEKMSELLSLNGGVFAYKDFILAKMIEDNSNVKIEEYFNALIGEGGKELMEDEELLTTGDCFLSNNLNVSETAREMYIHRNTLIYRLDKIERLTGLDIRNFSDALNFRIMFILSKLKG